MSKLREQLRRARDGHAAARYPGDLAAELLPRRAAGRPRWVLSMAAAGVAAAATAAAVVVAVVHRDAVPAGPARGDGRPLALSVPRPAEPEPLPVTYAFPSRMPLTFPVSPLMPTSPPVLVSLDGFPGNLGPFQQPYEELPRLMRHLNRHGFGPPAGEPLPDKGSALPTPTTQQAA